MTEKETLYDLCIVGAGISGLNALFVSTKYLNKNSKVLLIDKKDKAGGMWNTCYDHVRLHQPYIFFTVGNIKWNINKKRNYLATKPEIVSYLNYCLEKLSKKVDLEVKYDYELISNSEKKINNEFIAVSTYTKDTSEIKVHSKKLIKALGNGYSPHKPFSTTSKFVKSIIQEDFPEKIMEINNSNKPIYIIGGGKSGTDAADFLIRNSKKNSINILAGRGTLFNNREKVFPAGFKRYFGGVSPFDLSTKIANKFNGDNAEEIMVFFDKKHSLKIGNAVHSSSFGIISPEEIKFIKKGTNTILNDYLVDIVDRKDKIELILKSGKTIYSERGTWIVNCKENGFGKVKESEDYLSKSETTLSINLSSSILVLGYVSGYFLTHLFFLGKIKKLPLVKVNLYGLYKNNKQAYYPVVNQQNMYNLFTMFKVLPIRVLIKWENNVDNWYPILRQIYNAFKLLFFGKRMMSHFRKSLTIAGKKYNLNFGEVKK